MGEAVAWEGFGGGNGPLVGLSIGGLHELDGQLGVQ